MAIATIPLPERWNPPENPLNDGSLSNEAV